MNFIELFLIAIALSMDAFAVAMCLGLGFEKATFKRALIVGLYFGFFQAAMPLAGFFAAKLFAQYITAFDHWIAFSLLVLLGTKMILGSFEKEKENVNEASLSPKKMLPYAIATSIDALAVGISFALMQVEIFSSVLIIGVTTLALSMAGVKIGSLFGKKLKNKAEILGGVILILIGIKILLEHLGVIIF